MEHEKGIIISAAIRGDLKRDFHIRLFVVHFPFALIPSTPFVLSMSKGMIIPFMVRLFDKLTAHHERLGATMNGTQANINGR